MSSACDEVVRAYSSKGVKPIDPAAAVQQISIACDLGNAKGCLLAAQKYARGVWVPKDSDRASKLETRARDLADMSRIKGMLDRGCDARVGTDCYLLGSAYLGGNGAWNVPKDEPHGRALIRKACEIGGDFLDVECRMASGFESEQTDAQDKLSSTSACDIAPLSTIRR